MAPLCETFGFILSRIHVEKANGEPPRPLLERLYSTDYLKTSRSTYHHHQQQQKQKQPQKQQKAANNIAAKPKPNQIAPKKPLRPFYF